MEYYEIELESLYAHDLKLTNDFLRISLLFVTGICFKVRQQNSHGIDITDIMLCPNMS